MVISALVRPATTPAHKAYTVTSFFRGSRQPWGLLLHASGATFRAKLRTRILLKLHCHFGTIWGLAANDALRSSKPRPWVDTVEQVSGRCKVGLDSARRRNHAGIAIELGDRRAAAKEAIDLRR